MNSTRRSLIASWVVLIGLGALAFGLGFLPFDHGYRPLLMLPSLAMAALVVVSFMKIRSAPAIAQGFCVAAVFWLIVLLGLGMTDPLTRAICPTAGPETTSHTASSR